ncbi:MAG: isocitrate dehydrogenase [Actinobacteria bacterium 21-64-8]|nr:MAG: isocitrate dehydrogenase [Actinobacteria bacterium 21-64-8]
MNHAATIVVCDGDQTGQELLLESLRAMTPELLGVEFNFVHYDLSLEHRRATKNEVVREAAAAMVEAGLGLKAATVTPPEIGGVGSPNRLLREGIGGSVIVRTGRRIPGVTPPVAGTNQPIIVVRMAVGDAYGAAEGRDGDANSTGESAWRTERIERSVCRAVAEYAFVAAAQVDGVVYGGPKWTVSPVYEGMLKEEMDFAAARHPDVVYRPALIDAAYAGLLTEMHDATLVIPSLNRDGDCLSDMVLAMFGSIAGAESVLLALDEELRPTVAMAEAPHGTAPSLEGKNVANPMAMLLAGAALFDQAAARLDDDAFRDAGSRLRAATLEGAAAGVRTFDLGGEATTSEVVDDVIARLRARR